MPASYTIRRSVPRNTRRSKPASTPSTCFPSFSINLFMAFPLPRGDLSSNTTNIIREQETPSPFGCGYAALCYDAESGKLLWRRSVTRTLAEVPNPINGPTTPTPATDGRSVFVFFPDVGLLAYDLKGKERWRVPLGPFGGIQGMAASPIYAEGNVVLLIDTPE